MKGATCWVLYCWSLTVEVVLFYFVVNLRGGLNGVFLPKSDGWAIEISTLFTLSTVIYALMGFRSADVQFNASNSISAESMLHTDLIIHVIFDLLDIFSAFKTFLLFPHLIFKQGGWLRLVVGSVLAVALFFHSYSFPTGGARFIERSQIKGSEEILISRKHAALVDNIEDHYALKDVRKAPENAEVYAEICHFSSHCRAVPVSGYRLKMILKQIKFSLRAARFRYHLSCLLDFTLRINFWKRLPLIFPIIIFWSCQAAITFCLFRFHEESTVKFPIQIFDLHAVVALLWSWSAIPLDIRICFIIIGGQTLGYFLLGFLLVPLIDVFVVTLLNALKITSFFLIVLTFRDFIFFDDILKIKTYGILPQVGEYGTLIFCVVPVSSWDSMHLQSLLLHKWNKEKLAHCLEKLAMLYVPDEWYKNFSIAQIFFASHFIASVAYMVFSRIVRILAMQRFCRKALYKEIFAELNDENK
ncbi:hypothetical protein IE077_001137, partial [Cardiosporidium cionae]